MIIEYIRYQVPAVGTFFAKAKPFFPNIREMKHYQVK